MKDASDTGGTCSRVWGIRSADELGGSKISRGCGWLFLGVPVLLALSVVGLLSSWCCPRDIVIGLKCLWLIGGHRHR